MVDDVTRYVSACHRLGYQHPDLTAHLAQVRDSYAGEDGLDLRALDADCAVLTSLADAAEDAAREQGGLVAALSAAWSGNAAAAGSEFTARTARSAQAVGGAIRAAADAAANLRDALWSAVDAKVAAVESIDARQQAHRPEWLAAAETVTTGAGDLAAASELVDQQVKPFVVEDIGSDWLTAMRTARASIDEAFDRALARTTAGRPVVFEVPGELGPRPVFAETPANVRDSQSAPAANGPGGAPSAGWSGIPFGQPASWAATAPMGAAPPAESVALPAGAAPVTPPVSTVPASLPTGAAPAAPTPGELGGGASGLGGGASGFGQQLADLIGSLVGAGGGGLPDSADVDLADEDVGDEDVDDEDRDDAADDAKPGDDEDLEDPPPDDPPPDDAPPIEEAGEVVAEPTACPEDADGPGGRSAPVPRAVAPRTDSPPAPPAAAEPVSEPAQPTPCEIAADELPQVGE